MQKARMEQFKQRLLQIRERVSNELNGMISLVPEKGGHSGNLSNLPIHPADTSTEGLDTELMMIHNEEQILQDVEAALARIEGGAYGQCEDCQREIAESRLKALPFTTRCIECAQKHELEAATE